jgi:tRNA pseudouridine38-40 synthase
VTEAGDSARAPDSGDPIVAAEGAAAARTFRATVAYDGTDFFGWQIQPGRRTVQGLIEDAIESTTGRRVRVTGAGRTDRGVHATGQVASFDLATSLPTATLERALNATLPRDVALSGLAPAPAGWNARRLAVARVYIYTIARRRSPLARRTAWEMWAGLDLGRIRAASRALLGEHDMSTFTTSPPEGKSRVVRLSRVDWREEGDVLLAEFEADRFLRGMVRRIVGTLVEVGRGKREPDDVARILNARDRTLAGPTAPARGLCLVSATYPEAASEGEEPRSAAGVNEGAELRRDFPLRFD